MRHQSPAAMLSYQLTSPTHNIPFHCPSLKPEIPMKYISTRGGVSGVSFLHAILTGRAPDGGLYVPATLPCISKDEWRGMVGGNYEQLVKKVFRWFISEDEISTIELDGEWTHTLNGLILCWHLFIQVY